MLEQIHRVGTVGIDPETITGTVIPLVVDVIPDSCREGKEKLPAAFENLLNLLQTLIEAGVMIGIVLAVLGVTTAGILYLLPGEPRDRVARKTFKYTLIGLLIVIIGPSFVGFIVSELNPLCG
jgi:hypothetical protein